MFTACMYIHIYELPIIITFFCTSTNHKWKHIITQHIRYTCLILQIKPTWCTIFLSMFISFLYIFQVTMRPWSGETTVFIRHLVLVILYICIAEFYVLLTVYSCTKCRIDIVISPDDGHTVTWNMERKEINILRKIVHQVGFIYKIIQGCTPTKHKFRYTWFAICSDSTCLKNLLMYLQYILTNSFTCLAKVVHSSKL
jgi:hypothetical protein